MFVSRPMSYHSLLIVIYRVFYCYLSNFRNINGFDKDINHGVGGLRRFSLNVNNATLESLLTKLEDEAAIPDDDRDAKRAVSVIGRNINGRGELIWCLNASLALDREGNVVSCEDYGLEWVSHPTEGDGKFIAKNEMASVGEPQTSTRFFDAMCNF